VSVIDLVPLALLPVPVLLDTDSDRGGPTRMRPCAQHMVVVFVERQQEQ
jgi:hypothetical protein